MTKFARCGTNTEKNNIDNGINGSNGNHISGIFSGITEMGGSNFTREWALTIFWLSKKPRKIKYKLWGVSKTMKAHKCEGA